MQFAIIIFTFLIGLIAPPSAFGTSETGVMKLEIDAIHRMVNSIEKQAKIIVVELKKQFGKKNSSGKLVQIGLTELKKFLQVLEETKKKLGIKNGILQKIKASGKKNKVSEMNKEASLEILDKLLREMAKTLDAIQKQYMEEAKKLPPYNYSDNLENAFREAVTGLRRVYSDPDARQDCDLPELREQFNDVQKKVLELQALSSLFVPKTRKKWIDRFVTYKEKYTRNGFEYMGSLDGGKTLHPLNEDEKEKLKGIMEIEKQIKENKEELTYTNFMQGFKNACQPYNYLQDFKEEFLVGNRLYGFVELLQLVTSPISGGLGLINGLVYSSEGCSLRAENKALAREKSARKEELKKKLENKAMEKKVKA